MMSRAVSLEKYLQISPFLFRKLLLQEYKISEEIYFPSQKNVESYLSAFINLSRLSEVNLVNLWMKW